MVDMTAEVAGMNYGLVRRVARTVHVADLGVVAGIDEEERKVEREAVEGWDVANGEGVLGVVHEEIAAEELVDRILAGGPAGSSGKLGGGNDSKSGEAWMPGGADGCCGRPKSRTSSCGAGAVESVASRSSDVKVGTSGK